MATTYNNAQIGIVDANGNLNVIYPITKATNVAYKSTSVDAELTSLQSAVDTLKSNLSNYICKKLKVSLNISSSGNTYTFKGNISNTNIFGLLIIGFAKASSSNMGPCDVAIGLANNMIDLYRIYKNISFTTNQISSCNVSFSGSKNARTITVTAVSKGEQIGVHSIGYINLV